MTRKARSAAAGEINAYLRCNDPVPLASLLQSRKAIPKGVREFLAKLVLREIRRPAGKPLGAGYKWRDARDGAIIEELAKRSVKKNKPVDGFDKIEVGDKFGVCDREVDRVLQRYKEKNGISRYKRLIFVKKGK